MVVVVWVDSASGSEIQESFLCEGNLLHGTVKKCMDTSHMSHLNLHIKYGQEYIPTVKVDTRNWNPNKKIS